MWIGRSYSCVLSNSVRPVRVPYADYTRRFMNFSDSVRVGYPAADPCSNNGVPIGDFNEFCSLPMPSTSGTELRG